MNYKQKRSKKKELTLQQLNKQYAIKPNMVESGSELYTSNLMDIKRDMEEEKKEGYSQALKIIKNKEGVNKYRATFYETKKPYSFYWKRGGETELKDSDGQTAKQFLQEFRKEKIKPITPYAVSSVEMGMFESHLNESIKIAKPKDKNKLLQKASKMLKKTPYTNWSGD